MQFVKVYYDMAKSNLDPYALKVYVYIDCFNPCYPSQRQIAKDTGLSLNRVKKSIAILVEQGHVVILSKGRYKRDASVYKVRGSRDDTQLYTRNVITAVTSEIASETSAKASSPIENSQLDTVSVKNINASGSQHDPLNQPTKEDKEMFNDQLFIEFKELLTHTDKLTPFEVKFLEDRILQYPRFKKFGGFTQAQYKVYSEIKQKVHPVVVAEVVVPAVTLLPHQIETEELLKSAAALQSYEVSVLRNIRSYDNANMINDFERELVSNVKAKLNLEANRASGRAI